MRKALGAIALAIPVVVFTQAPADSVSSRAKQLHDRVIVGISHVADKTFFDAIETTTAPMIASHSSSRVIANHARNMTADMMRALARNSGVVMIGRGWTNC